MYIFLSANQAVCPTYCNILDFSILTMLPDPYKSQQYSLCKTIYYLYISLSKVPEAARWGPLKGRAISEQVSVEMQADVGLKALRKSLQYAVHVDTICVRPGMLQEFGKVTFRCLQYHRMVWQQVTWQVWEMCYAMQ
jgi:hypothetical protein